MKVRSLRLERRRGVVLVLFAVVLVALCAFLALAIDIGVMAVAQGQCQNAADAAAMNAVRQLNGTTGNNSTACQGSAQSAVNVNAYLGTQFSSVGNVTVGGSPNSSSSVLVGYYYYSTSTSSFLLSFPTDMTQSSTGAVSNPGGNFTAVQAQVKVGGTTTAFGQMLGVASFNSTSIATAVDRPRDIALLVDFSGSMRFSSMVGIDYSYGRYCTNNPGTNQPAFGSWNATDGAQSMTNQNGTGNLMVQTSATTNSPLAGYLMQAINLSESNNLNLNRPLLVNDYFSNAQGATAVAAWPSTYPQPNSYAITPGGDQPLQLSGGAYAKTAYSFLGNSNTYNQKYETGSGSGTAGYSAQSTIYAYQVGPNYWGIRFAVWPPIPPNIQGGGVTKGSGDNQSTFTGLGLPVDWRQAFFLNAKNPGTAPVTNTMLWNNNGQWQTPSSPGTAGGYLVNYQNILAWIVGNPSNPFPSQLRAGNIQYYSSIPNPGIDLTGTGTLNKSFWNWTGLLSNLDQQFWKDYIDWVLGQYQYEGNGTSWTNMHGTTTTSNYTSSTAYGGYGGDFNWSDNNNSTAVSQTYTPTATGSAVSTTANVPYAVYDSTVSKWRQTMAYSDNPQRSLTYSWFGPVTLVDFLGSYNAWGPTNYQRSCAWPGTAHEAVTYVCKLGLQAAIQDSENNHPNDNLCLGYYSSPMDVAPNSNYTNDPGTRFNRIRTPLGQNYTSMINHLWYPPYTIDNPGTHITPYDYANNPETPRASGGTDYAYGFMLAYNQFSANTTIQNYNPSPAPVGDAGGLGRIGAQKLVILETDGFPNTTASATLNSGGGTYKQYYQILYNSTTPSAGQFPNNVDSGDNSATIAQELVNDYAFPYGSSTPRKPVKIYCIAFGPVFNGSDPSAAASAMSSLSNLQTIGNNSGVSVPTIYGTDAQMASGLQTAITNVVQSEIPVSLIK